MLSLTPTLSLLFAPLAGGRVSSLSPSPDRCGEATASPDSSIVHHVLTLTCEQATIGEPGEFVPLYEKDILGMNPTLLAYLGSVVVLLILIWAALEMRSRFVRMRRRKLENAWIKLDSTFVDTKQEESLSSPGEESEDQEEKPGQDFHARAQQNGHYSESKKLL